MGGGRWTGRSCNGRKGWKLASTGTFQQLIRNTLNGDGSGSLITPHRFPAQLSTASPAPSAVTSSSAQAPGEQSAHSPDEGLVHPGSVEVVRAPCKAASAAMKTQPMLVCSLSASVIRKTWMRLRCVGSPWPEKGSTIRRHGLVMPVRARLRLDCPSSITASWSRCFLAPDTPCGRGSPTDVANRHAQHPCDCPACLWGVPDTTGVRSGVGFSRRGFWISLAPVPAQTRLNTSSRPFRS